MLRKSSLTQEAYETLRADLLACRLKPGEPLRINELCERLSVSLGAVREALSRLISEGLVSAEPQRGFRAAPISAVDLKDLTMVRTEIEGLCLRRAIAMGDVSWESRIVAAFHQLSRTPYNSPGDPQRLSDAFAVAHGQFHEALVSACDSPWLLRLRAMLFAQSERYRGLSVPLAKYDRDRDREHRELMEALLARDADRAVRLITAHVQTTTQILLDAMNAPSKLDERRKASRPKAKPAKRAGSMRAAKAI